MAFNRQNKRAYQLIAGFAVCSAILSGCAKDRTIDDFNNDKVKQKLGEYQAVAGTYRGSLVSLGDGSSLGAVTLELTPQLESARAQNGLNPEAHASLTGTLTFMGKSRAVLISKDVSYDNNNHTMAATLSLNGAQTGSKLDLSAAIAEDTVEGELKSLDSSEYGARLVLKKDAVEPSAEALIQMDTTQLALEKISKTYTANSKFHDGSPMNVEVIVTPTELSSDEQFLTTLSSNQKLNIKVNVNGKANQFAFNKAQWDRRNGLIKSEVAIGTGAGALSLACTELPDAKLTCTMNDSSKRVPIFQNLVLNSAVIGKPASPVTPGTPGAQPSPAPTRPALPTGPESFFGISKWVDGKQAVISMKVRPADEVSNDPSQSTDQKVDVSLDIDRGSLKFAFVNARWDHQAGTLIGDTTIGGGRVRLGLNCVRAGDAWKCNIMNSAKGTLFNQVLLGAGTDPTPNDREESRQYSSIVKFSDGEKPLTLKVRNTDMADEAQSDITDERVDLTLTFEKSGVDYGFPASRWDHQTGTLTGTVTVGGSRQSTLNLKCRKVSETELNCSLISSSSGVVFSNSIFTLNGQE